MIDRCLKGKLWSTTSEGEPIGEIGFTMGSRHAVKAREVRQHVWLRRVELPAQKGQSVVAHAWSLASSTRPPASSRSNRPSGLDSEKFMSLLSLYEHYVPAVTPTLLYKTMGSAPADRSFSSINGA